MPLKAAGHPAALHTHNMLFTGGGQLTVRQHQLSRDGRLLLVCAASSVRVYSAVTAELLFTLQGHSEEVTCLALHPANALEIYSASRDGTIALWDLQEGTRVQSWQVIGEPIESMVVIGQSAFVTCYWRDAKAGRVLQFNLSKGVPESPRGKLSRPRALAAAANGALVATFDRHTVLAWDPQRFGAAPPLAMHHTKPITCVAISPDGSKLAAGDATGRILIWHDVVAAAAAKADTAAAVDLDAAAALDLDAADETSPPEPPAATVHWHAQAVGCLTFSVDGTHLLSGGSEAVLVMWDAVTGKRAYLPRLGGALVGIVGCEGDGAKYALRQADNTLRMVNAAAMVVVASVHGLRPPPTGLPVGAAAPLTFHPQTGLLILSGPHATLQWYDLCRDAHVDKLQLSQRNIVSLTESDAAAMGGVYGPPAEPAATAMACSGDGSVLATVESRPDAAGGGAVQHCLKFWDKAEGGKAQYGAPYRLNTVADQPHRSSSGGGTVTSLAFHPSLPLAATTSGNGEFKVWSRQRLRVTPTPGRKEGTEESAKIEEESMTRVTTWRCAAVGGYTGEALTASAFSHDGSVLALGSVSGGVSLWDATQTALLGVLPPALHALGPSAAVRQLLFLAKSPLLLAVTTTGVALYNLLTKRCEWGAEVQLGAVAADPGSPHWAAVLLAPDSQTATGASSGAPQSAAVQGVDAPQEQQQQQAGDREQGIVAFRGAGRQPVGAWVLKRTGAGGPGAGTALGFASVGTPLHAAAAGASLPGMGPLVVLTGDREYSIARREGAPAGEAAGAAGGLAQRAQHAAPSAYEAMYGKLPAIERSEAPASLAAAAAEGGTVGARPAWAALFDGPSHALPPLATLCPAFLELVVIGGGAAAAAAAAGAGEEQR